MCGRSEDTGKSEKPRLRTTRSAAATDADIDPAIIIDHRIAGMKFLTSSALLAALALGSSGAFADPAGKRSVALTVDVSKNQASQLDSFEARQFDLNGLPVQVTAGTNNAVGLQAGRQIDLGGGLSLDNAASARRRFDPAAVFAPARGAGEMTTGTTARFQQGGWDIALFPGLSTAQLAADRLPSYAMGGSVARKGLGGWVLSAQSRYELRRTEMLTGVAGTNAQGQFGANGLSMLGGKLDLDYLYDWTQPSANAANLSHGPSVALDLGLSDALNCRLAYHYAFAGDVESTSPDFAWLGDGGQDLTVGWDWDLTKEGLRGTSFGAAFSYHQDFFAAAEPGVSSGGINFATTF
jgi:hypothetical protein